MACGSIPPSLPPLLSVAVVVSLVGAPYPLTVTEANSVSEDKSNY